jgi:hypothetical protein
MDIHLYPLVAAMNRPVTFSVEGLCPGARYLVRIRPRRHLAPSAEHEGRAGADGCLRLDATLSGRGEYTVDVHALPGEGHLAQKSVYAAPAALLGRRPLRCDFHIHTRYSDGQASPAEMLIRGRKLGLDVAVITDHNHYGASLEAAAEAERLALDLITAPGEEVSGPDWHVLAIDADAAIFEPLQEAWGKEGLWAYEALHAAVEAIHAHGGRAYLAHPYWAVPRGYHQPTETYQRILEAGTLDGIELLGDVLGENNLRSLAHYLDWRAAGHDIPIIANSDTHRLDHTYGLYWTLAFVPVTPGAAIRIGDVLEAIAGGWSVACTTAPAGGDRGRSMQAYGSFELVDYAYFLEQQFFAEHDLLCAEEAALARRAWLGDTLPPGAMGACRERMEALYWRSSGR